MEGAEKDLVASRDGTPIAVWRRGSGPALLLVHGTVADHSTTWRRVVPILERRFTVHAMDRRGRGESGDGRPAEWPSTTYFHPPNYVVVRIPPRSATTHVGTEPGAITSPGAPNIPRSDG